jgi:ABC-type multidrug transport system ATPase subunit
VSTISKIEVRGVTRLFGAHAALRAVDVTFAPGPITFVQGHNGAGKSTLLSIVGTVLRPTDGHVVYAPLGTNRALVRQHIGWVAHESHCYAELTGKENVELAARIYGVDPVEGWQRMSERVQAQRFGRQPVGTLSRGQRQRIALARALVHSPAVLLLDEPLTGLDQGASQRLEEILIEERDRGTIVIVVSHTLGMAERMGGRKVQMHNGRIQSIEEP